MVCGTSNNMTKNGANNHGNLISSQGMIIGKDFGGVGATSNKDNKSSRKQFNHIQTYNNNSKLNQTVNTLNGFIYEQINNHPMSQMTTQQEKGNQSMLSSLNGAGNRMGSDSLGVPNHVAGGGQGSATNPKSTFFVDKSK